MEKVLNQEQIDAMVRAARGTSGSASTPVQPWDARQASQIGRQQVQAISALHEDFAGNLTRSVGAYLRVAFTATLVSAEHLTYSEVLHRIPELTYLSTCKLLPLETKALLQLDLAVAFPLIEVLLGGEGKGGLLERQITVIEEQILEAVMRIICRELENAWQMLSLKVEFEERQNAEQVQHLMNGDEKTLALSFEVTVAEKRGALNLVFPALVSNALLRKMSAHWAQTKRRVQPEETARLRAHLLASPFALDLGVRVPRVRLQDLLHMTPGMLFRMNCSIEQRAELRIGNREMFSAIVARRGPRRAAQVIAGEQNRSQTEK